MKERCRRKGRIAITIVLALAFCLALATGCAKKEVVKEEAAMPQQKVEAPAPPPEEMPPEPAPMPEMKMEAAAAPEQAPYDFRDIHFDFDKYTLRPGDREILKGHAEWLQKNGDYAVQIEGHCDERGTAEYNMALGDRRAGEARKYLVELGVAENRISTVSYGKERPLDPGHNEEAWAKNRRDHFVPTKNR